jgi:hypothetical protein
MVYLFIFQEVSLVWKTIPSKLGGIFEDASNFLDV